MGTRISVKSAVTVKPLGTIEIFVSAKNGGSVEDRSTARNVGVVVVNYRSVIPVGPPVMPPPAVATEVPESKAYAKRNSRSVKVESGVWIPARPDCYRRPIDQPGIVLRHVHDAGVCWLNSDRLALRGYRLLSCAFQVSGFLGALTHHLNGGHPLLRLVQICGAKRW